MLRTIAAALPKRQFRLKDQTTKRGGLMSIFFMQILFLAMGIGCLAWVYLGMLPEIQRDWTISKDAVPFTEARISNGKCRTTNFIFNDCKVDISYTNASKYPVKKHVELTFLDFHSGSYSVEAVRSASNPDLVTLDLSIETLWNRIGLALGLVGFGLLMFVGGFIITRKSLKTRKQVFALNEAKLRPVSVNILKQGQNNGYTVITYTHEEGGIKKKYNVSFKKQVPFLLSSPPNAKTMAGATALGLAADGVDHVFLVDEELSRLDIDDMERQTIWNARQSALAT